MIHAPTLSVVRVNGLVEGEKAVTVRILLVVVVLVLKIVVDFLLNKI